MVDVEQAIKQIEGIFGRQLTEKEKQAITLFGGFMNCIWENEPMDEQMLEKDCFTCANAFVDDDDKLHCMADCHDHEQIVADDYTCDDWTR